MFKNTEYDVWSFSSLMGPTDGNIFDLKWPSLILKTDMLKDNKNRKAAFDTICEFINWSHDHLLRNEAPDLSFENREFGKNTLSYRLRKQPLMPEGWRVAFVGCKADAKARAAMNSFTRYYGAKFICESCWACKGA